MPLDVVIVLLNVLKTINNLKFEHIKIQRTQISVPVSNMPCTTHNLVFKIWNVIMILM